MGIEKKPVSPLRLFLLAAAAFALFVVGQLGWTYFRVKKDVDRIRHIVASEELILKLNAELGSLSRSAWNLSLPDRQSRSFFAKTVQIVDVAYPDGLTTMDVDAATVNWQPADSITEFSSDDLVLWKSLFTTISHFDHAKFYFVNGHFEDDTNLDSFETTVGFQGLARQSNGQWVGIRSKQIVHWNRVGERGAERASAPWQISSWKVKSFSTSASPQMMFAEALAYAVPSDDQLSQLRFSEHEKAVSEFYANGANKLPWPYFTPISANQRPGVSVVDIDQDGFDDLYVMVRRGRNQLLRNRGDGTFDEVAQQWGLDVENFSSCGIFADFDNDGDPDLMLGRSVADSLYFENTGKRYQQKSVSAVPFTLPQLVVSMSAVDFNRDGLLDVYFSTYRPAVLESLISSSETDEQGKDAWNTEIVEDSKRWPAEFLAPKVAVEYEARVAATQKDADEFGKILDQVGPPNVLLVNRGAGRFEIAPESEQLAVWRNTLQATWADFDQDGDADLYVANDWATDNLFRNDGDGFTEISAEMGTTEFGFGMGVSWGDYDRDGRQDLYVSNMYSKAGRRIMGQIAELNPNFQRSVAGNYLYRSTDEGFQLVSGLEAPSIPVAEAGWSWGGQFADFNNDGFLDLYVMSGYFTAPSDHASNVDL